MRRYGLYLSQRPIAFPLDYAFSKSLHTYHLIGGAFVLIGLYFGTLFKRQKLSTKT